jgi:hypothetical protein
MYTVADDRWFYATDVPKRKLIPDLNEKPKTPTKWSAFAPRDSKALEVAYQQAIANPLEQSPTVPVNEDHLFEVNIVERELRPVYFRGSTYDVTSLTNSNDRSVEQAGFRKKGPYYDLVMKVSRLKLKKDI